MNLARHQLKNDPSDPTEDMTPEQYGAALVRWMDAEGPMPILGGFRHIGPEVHAALIVFLNKVPA